jgi:hypothetical protein
MTKLWRQMTQISLVLSSNRLFKHQNDKPAVSNLIPSWVSRQFIQLNEGLSCT